MVDSATSTELLVRILTDANTKGITDTARSLEGLRESAAGSNSASNDAAAGFDNLGRATRETQRTASILANIMRGDLNGAIRQMPGLLNASAAGLARLGAAGIGAGIGWNLGRRIDEMGGLSDAAGKVLAKTLEVRGEFEAMSKTSLDDLRESLDGITQVSLKDMEAAYKRVSDAAAAHVEEVAKMVAAEEDLARARINADVASGKISREEGDRRLAGVGQESAGKTLDAQQQSLDKRRTAMEAQLAESQAKAADLEVKRAEAEQRLKQAVASGPFTDTERGRLLGGDVSVPQEARAGARGDYERSMRGGADRDALDRKLREIDEAAAAFVEMRRYTKEAGAAGKNVDSIRGQVTSAGAGMDAEQQRINMARKAAELNAQAATDEANRREAEKAAAAAAKERAEKQRAAEEELAKAEKRDKEIREVGGARVEKEAADVVAARAGYAGAQEQGRGRLGGTPGEARAARAVRQQELELSAVSTEVADAIERNNRRMEALRRQIEQLKSQGETSQDN